jgi:hypothetical protein
MTKHDVFCGGLLTIWRFQGEVNRFLACGYPFGLRTLRKQGFLPKNTGNSVDNLCRRGTLTSAQSTTFDDPETGRRTTRHVLASDDF